MQAERVLVLTNKAVGLHSGKVVRGHDSARAFDQDAYGASTTSHSKKNCLRARQPRHSHRFAPARVSLAGATLTRSSQNALRERADQDAPDPAVARGCRAGRRLLPTTNLPLSRSEWPTWTVCCGIPRFDGSISAQVSSAAALRLECHSMLAR